MSKMAIMLCLDVCREKNINLTLFYAEAKIYNPSREAYESAKNDRRFHRPSIQVYTGVGAVIRVARLSSVAMQGEPAAAIMFMSFNELLTQSLLSSVYPSRLFLVNGRPPEHKWREEATAWIHEDLRSEWPQRDNEVMRTSRSKLPLPKRVTSTLKYSETCDVLLGLYWMLAENYRIILAPTGSKMQTVGCFLAKALHPDIQIEYPTPKGFLPLYSEGKGQTWSIEFGRLGDRIDLLRSEERKVHLSVFKRNWRPQMMKQRTKVTRKPERLPNIHPGRIIKKVVLEATGITQTDLAPATGMHVSRLNDLVKERRGITVDSAIRLGKALGTTPELWLNLQRSYDLEEAMLAHQKDYDSLVPLPSRTDI